MKNLPQSYHKFIIEIFSNGGSSYNPNFLTKPTQGYMVSIKDSEICIELDKVPFIDKGKVINSAFESLLKNNASHLDNEYIFIGGWIHENKLYFDISINYQDLTHSIKEGIIEDQIAIFDLNNMKEIFLPKPQKTGTIYQKISYAKSKADELAKRISRLKKSKE